MREPVSSASAVEYFDYFPYYSQYPLRIEFFDTEVDSIRTFDKDSQRTIDRCDEARITPAGELVPDDKERAKLVKAEQLA